ncbi:hypothetical protein ANCDUO_05077 [Ancylostoma duodenale]|uniref:Uncharacterized protein n=1 Tax=Ancylostoma duodenale TaxID=51022 RepID=A0A0C2GZG0_9BILA|nr:hypothetical protein ANCDUO_05077 [Ancylostoma duodenale]
MTNAGSFADEYDRAYLERRRRQSRHKCHILLIEGTQSGKRPPVIRTAVQYFRQVPNTHHRADNAVEWRPREPGYRDQRAVNAAEWRP